MAGVDFDRQAFIPAAQPAQRPAPRLVVPLVLMLAVAALGFVGYKLFSQYSQGTLAANPQGLEQIQEQLAGMEKRLDQLEKHRKVSVAETPASTAPPVQSQHTSGNPSPKRPAYKITSGSALDPQPKPSSPPQPMVQSPTTQPRFTSSDETAIANHEAWQATTNRLADVVGVVGSQQGELSQAREDINRLLAQTKRSAIQFELRHGANREPVGPVSLVLKAADPRNHRYTICVYLENHCTELKDRAQNEVVVFVLNPNSAPLELVATKILRDQVVGYLEVPVE
jgi:hypothetical protein